ncbi:MAG TPA: penicillin-binding transpeptidase domain-containing protein, partial [Longimicrobiaceae bacterium]|nr:penicillin-binding transpeptidase domain-containing protein [Longimicrobiaceae bacterium]
AVREGLRSVLGVSRALAARATDPDRRWVVIPGRFSVEQREKLGNHAGVYFERQLERFYPQGSVGRELIGVVTRDGRALGGVEQEFDDQLRGTPGYAIQRRDARGRNLPSLSLPVVPPKDGADVVLTIDFDLQEIADAALTRTIQSSGASGGDLLLLDPRTGDVLAAVSKRDGRAVSLGAITEPFEPGSVMKPIAAASLLAEHLATPRDSVFAENGRWVTPEGRVINDDEANGWLSLTDVLRVSSNIGISKFAARMTPGEQYQYLRAFGFGTPTGVEFPGESGGRLRKPANWSKLSQQSLAMGYEVAVTPLQLAAAYGALADHGVLMEPHLLREVREADGTVVEKTEPRVLRRVVPAAVAKKVTRMLETVVDSGTATRAALANYQVAGKTGTARRTGPNGHYERGSYTASFIGYFPAKDPQLVIYAKIDQPQGAAYFGGLTAAPVTRETLEGILAARNAPLDGASLLAARLEEAPSPAPRHRAEGPLRPLQPEREGTYVFELGASLAEPRPPAPAAPVPLPDLSGLPLRDAIRRAHSLGLHVELRGGGKVASTAPAAGASISRGDTLTLLGGRP